MKLKQFNKNSELSSLKKKSRKEFVVKNRTLILSIGILILSIVYFTYASYITLIDFTLIDANVAQFQGFFTLTLDLDGGSASQSEISVSRISTIGDLETPTKENNEFLGWVYDDDSPVLSTDKLKHNTTIHAKWERLIWTITYDKNGGDSISKESEEINRGDKIASMPTGSKTQDYTYTYPLDGWYTDPTGGIKIDENSEITENMTLYAHWTPTYIDYTITYNGNGGTPARASDVKYYNESVKLPSATKSQTGTHTYSFAGWYTDVSGGTLVGAANADYVIGNTTTLYAHWTATARTCNVNRTSGSWTAIYSCVGGVGTMTSCMWDNTTCWHIHNGISNSNLWGCQRNNSGGCYASRGCGGPGSMSGQSCTESSLPYSAGAGFGEGTWSCSCP